MSRIKVLSLQQPWAHLVIIGEKQFETRGWQTHYRGELYIHASKSFAGLNLELCQLDPHFKKAIPDPSKLKLGAIIGKVKLVHCLPTEEYKFVESLSEKEKAFGDYRPGRFAWVLENPEPIEPIEVSGNLNIWNFEMKEVAHG